MMSAVIPPTRCNIPDAGGAHTPLPLKAGRQHLNSK